MAGELRRRLAVVVTNARAETGLSQEAFGERLGYHRTWIGGVERGEKNLTLSSIEDLAKRLGIDPLELFGAPPELRLTAAADGDAPTGDLRATARPTRRALPQKRR